MLKDKHWLTVVILGLLLLEVSLGVVISNTILVSERLGGKLLIDWGSAIPGTIRPGQSGGKESRGKDDLKLKKILLVEKTEHLSSLKVKKLCVHVIHILTSANVTVIYCSDI